MTKPILIIDPGHGGRDPGGGTNKHWKEKDMVLQISLYQYNRYKELGVPVAITRTTDKYLSPEERTKIVRNSGAKYCHSNHINAGGGDGAEVIHSIYDKTKMANMIAAELRAVGQNVRRVFTRTLPGNNNADYYFMIRDTGKVITNIIEYGFADSPKDDVDQLLNNWQEYAEAVVKAFCLFAGYKYVAPSKPEPDGVYWDDMKMNQGQIGRISILKPINLWKRVDVCNVDDCEYCKGKQPELKFERILNPGERYRVYGYDGYYGGQYAVGSGYYVTNIEGYLNYETPSTAKLEALREFYK